MYQPSNGPSALTIALGVVMGLAVFFCLIPAMCVTTLVAAPVAAKKQPKPADAQPKPKEWAVVYESGIQENAIDVPLEFAGSTQRMDLSVSGIDGSFYSAVFYSIIGKEAVDRGPVTQTNTSHTINLNVTPGECRLKFMCAGKFTIKIWDYR